MVIDTTLVVMMTVRPTQERKCETALIDKGWILDTGEELQEKPLWPLMPHQPYGLLKLMQDIFIDPTKYLKNILMKQ